MLGLYHLFFPLSQGRDESEKDSGLELVKDNWVLLKEFTFFVDFLHLLYIVHREYTCSVVQGLLKPPL